MALPPSSAPPLDFEALLSRDYRPALVTRLIPREKYHPDDKKKNAVARTTQAEPNPEDEAQKRLAEETSRLMLSLVAETPAFKRHPLPEGERFGRVPESLIDKPPAKSTAPADIPPQFHEIVLSDWESKINNWSEFDNDNNKNNGTTNKLDPLALLERPRNYHLDNLTFDNLAWDGDTAELRQRALHAPLILEIGVAGQSVANHVYQKTVLSAQRPTPALKSAAYRDRLERDWNSSSSVVTSTADVGKGTLHSNKDRQNAIIEMRQRRREQMAEDKTSRVAKAMGTVAFGGGRGRTVTSSLMGPGGTERTGRPSRALASGVHETEYIEQLDLVNSHSLVKGDWSKIILRQYRRPKLPLSVLRPDTSWQLQIRFIPTGKKTDASGQSSSFQAIMMGTHAGAVSKERLRNEADLSPTEGKLILVEYMEEQPPIQLTKGMCSKIVNYYRGDKARCPVSAGGGDRPARRKRGGDGASGGPDGAPMDSKNDRLPRLEGPNRKTSMTDWVGKVPKKSQKDRSEKEEIDVLPEGVTEILHPKVHGPFIGEVEDGVTITGLISNLFVAPMFRHEPESTDFIMILTPPGGAARPGQRERMGVILRDLPANIFTVGQTEPRQRVMAPGSQAEKNFINPFVSFLIARALNRTQSRDDHGLRFDEIQDRVLPSYDLPPNSLRQRLKHVAIFDKTTQIWTSKAIGYDDYPGVVALERSIAPESVAAFESSCAARRRLTDLGVNQLVDRGGNTVVSVGVTMFYLSAQLNALREISRKTKKLGELSKTNRSLKPIQLKFYEKASEELELQFKSLKQKHEVAQYIYEELQLAPWHVTGDFLDVHKKGEGTGMMKLTGLGDPSGQGEGFSFLREADAKPNKSVGNGALNAEIKKITGTDDDLRKLTMKQMAALLRSYGMAQKQIDTLKRWDRVHVIRDLSTKAASDGIGDGLERFARGEKMKLSEQKQMYAERIKVIWKRQIAALSAPGDRAMGAAADADVETETNAGSEAPPRKTADTEKDDSGSDSDVDDFEAALEDEMADRTEANQLVAEHARGGDSEGGLSHLRAATQNQALTKEALEYRALMRQREEEREAKEGLKSKKPDGNSFPSGAFMGDRKVIRKRITKTHPDGRQTTTFKFILHPEEVGKIMARLQQDPESGRPRKSLETKYEHGVDEKPPGHAMFEDDDDFEYSSKGRMLGGRRRGGGRKRGPGGRATSRPRNTQLGKLKTAKSTEDRIRKRKKEEDELDVYVSSAKRKGTSNRRERGSVRERKAHIIFGETLEAIRLAVESRPSAGPFLKPVNRRLIPRYYEVISHPMDLATIKDKNSRYEYRTADAFVRDFELMKSNASKFNGPSNPIALEAAAIYDFVKQQVESSRSELNPLENAVDEVFSGQGKKKKQKLKKRGKAKKPKSSIGSTASAGGLSVNLGYLSGTMNFDSDSDSDDDSVGGFLGGS